MEAGQKMKSFKFENLISEIRTLDLENNNQDNIEKCKHCIYEDAVKDVNAAYGYTSDDQITMTFEGASNE